MSVRPAFGSSNSPVGVDEAQSDLPALIARLRDPIA
jgi:hypothetical protein